MQTEGNSICPASVGWHGVPSITYNTAGGCLPLPHLLSKGSGRVVSVQVRRSV